MRVQSARLGIALAVSMLPAMSAAEPIEQACLASERAAGNRALCDCIQDAANRTLTERDQRLAARFFSDPHRAQVVRQSKSRSHEAFWMRYEAFGEIAETYCGR